MRQRWRWRGVGTDILFGVVLCLTAAGCAPLPDAFTPLDERHLNPPHPFTRTDESRLNLEQLLNDEAFCRGEIKNNLSTANQTTTGGPTEDAIAVYTVCMAQKGYRAK